MVINITSSSPLSLPPDGFMGLAGVAMLMNITSSSPLSLLLDGFMGLAGVAMLMNIVNFLYSLLITMGWLYSLILLDSGAKRYSLKVSTHTLC